MSRESRFTSPTRRPRTLCAPRASRMPRRLKPVPVLDELPLGLEVALFGLIAIAMILYGYFPDAPIRLPQIEYAPPGPVAGERGR